MIARHWDFTENLAHRVLERLQCIYTQGQLSQWKSIIMLFYLSWLGNFCDLPVFFFLYSHFL